MIYHVEDAVGVGEEAAQLAFAVVQDDRVHHPEFIGSIDRQWKVRNRSHNENELKTDNLKQLLYVYNLFPSIQPGKGSLQVLSITLGLMVTTGISPRMLLITISPMALVNTYVSCHPWSFALPVTSSANQTLTNVASFRISD